MVPTQRSSPERPVVVVGGGIVGLSTALRLAQGGAEVALLEAVGLGHGATGTSFAWLNSSDKGPFAYHLLNVTGMAEHRVLARELDDATWLHLDGHVEWAAGGTDPGWIEAKAARLRGWGYPVEWVTRRELRWIEPALRLPDGVERALLAPMEGHVRPGALMASLRRSAVAAGVRICTGVDVVDVRATAGRAQAVVTDGGARMAASFVVICAGARAAELPGSLGIDIPMHNTVGLLTYSTAVSGGPRTTITSGRVNVRPDGRGRFCIQAIDLDPRATDPTLTQPLPALARTALARAQQVVPALAGAEVATARTTTRPIPADGLPVVGRLPNVENAYVAVTHSGVTLGPLLGRLAAREILHGRVDERLEPFRPARFRSSGPPSSLRFRG